jgi:hypothetical protein
MPSGLLGLKASNCTNMCLVRFTSRERIARSSAPGVGVREDAARQQRLEGADGHRPGVVVGVPPQLPQPVVLLPHRRKVDALPPPGGRALQLAQLRSARCILRYPAAAVAAGMTSCY